VAGEEEETAAAATAANASPLAEGNGSVTRAHLRCRAIHTRKSVPWIRTLHIIPSLHYIRTQM